MVLRWASWVQICLLVQAQLTPRLVAAYASEASRLAAALVALNRYAAHTLDVLGRGLRRAQERELHDAEKNAALAGVRFKALAESGMLGVLICDYAGNIVEANDGFLETFGYCRADLLSGRVQWLAMTPPEWRHLDESAIEQLQVYGKTRPWEKEYFHKNGSRVPVLVGVASLNEAQTIAFVLDISERKRLEAVRARSVELETENRRIQEASRLKSEFLANMSHELRTPLNSIIGFAELLHDREVDPDSPQYLEFLGDILKSGRHLLQLINDVLDLAKVEAGKIELRPEPVDIAQLIAEVSAVVRGAASGKQIRIEAEVADGCPARDARSGALQADPLQLPLERAQVHPGEGQGRGQRAHGEPRHAVSDRGGHGDRHRASRSGAAVRRLPAARGGRHQEARRNGPRPRAHQAAGRGAGRLGGGEEHPRERQSVLCPAAAARARERHRRSTHASEVRAA